MRTQLTTLTLLAATACGSNGTMSADAGGRPPEAAGPAADGATGEGSGYQSAADALAGDAEVPDARSPSGVDAAPAVCPASQPAPPPDLVTVTACTQLGANCAYGAICCACVPAPSCGGGNAWNCASTTKDPDCPAALPADGSTCPTSGVGCSYCTAAGFFQAFCWSKSGQTPLQWSVSVPSLGCIGPAAAATPETRDAPGPMPTSMRPMP